jgi:VanZ family protein
MNLLFGVQTVVCWEGDFMRSFLILVWCAVILLFTCTASFHDLVQYGIVRFQWSGEPEFAMFFSPLPDGLSSGIIIQKVGHVITFHLLTLLLLLKLRSRITILLLAASFASLTEILQLYFTRSGRLVDVGLDLIGILIALGLASLFRHKPSKHFDF